MRVVVGERERLMISQVAEVGLYSEKAAASHFTLTHHRNIENNTGEGVCHAMNATVTLARLSSTASSLQLMTQGSCY